MKKSIAIIGEGETEWFYFDSLRVASRYPFRLAPDFPAHSDIDHLLKLSKAKMKEGYDYVVCLLDMDRLNSVPAEMKKYRVFKNRKENKGIMFIETNPCTEFWFFFISCRSCRLSTIPRTNNCYPNCKDTCPVMRRQKVLC